MEEIEIEIKNYIKKYINTLEKSLLVEMEPYMIYPIIEELNIINIGMIKEDNKIKFIRYIKMEDFEIKNNTHNFRKMKLNNKNSIFYIKEINIGYKEKIESYIYYIKKFTNKEYYLIEMDIDNDYDECKIILKKSDSSFIELFIKNKENLIYVREFISAIMRDIDEQTNT